MAPEQITQSNPNAKDQKALQYIAELTVKYQAAYGVSVEEAEKLAKRLVFGVR